MRTHKCVRAHTHTHTHAHTHTLQSQQQPPNEGLALRTGQEDGDTRRDTIERDEKRLAELGRKTIEMYVISHIFTDCLEVCALGGRGKGLRRWWMHYRHGTR